jgi:Ca-activated chloride channel homolog
MSTVALCLTTLLALPLSSGPSAQTTTLRVQVSLVTVGVRVTDKDSREVRGLRAEDFRISEDGVPQPIAFFSGEEQPLSLGILLDRSNSMGSAGKLLRAQAAAESLIRRGLPGDEFFFLPFDHTVPDSRGFSTDRDRIVQEIHAASAGGGTSLYDAIVKGLDRFAAARHRRQVLVAITDGADQQSIHTLDQVIRRIQQSRVQMFLLGYFAPEEDQLFRKGTPTVSLIDGTPIDNPRVVFERMAAESGARAFFPTSDEALRQAVEAIAADLRTQYTLAYYPPNPDQLDKYRSIRVEVRRRGLSVRTRRGYILRTDAATGPATTATEAPARRELAAGKTGPTGTLAETLPGSVRRCENFSDPTSGWPVRADAFYAGTSYRLKGSDVLVTRGPQAGDFRARLHFEVPGSSARMEGSPALGRETGAGLVFRAGPEGFYAVVVYSDPASPRGACVALLWEENHFQELAQWPVTVSRGRTVELEVAAVGGRMDVLFGGRLLGAFKNERFASGSFGLILSGSGEARFYDLCVEPAVPGPGTQDFGKIRPPPD